MRRSAALLLWRRLRPAAAVARGRAPDPPTGAAVQARWASQSAPPSPPPTANTAQARHAALKSTLGRPPTTAAPGPPAGDGNDTAAASVKLAELRERLRRERVRHGAVQSALAFVTVLVAAQSLATAQDRRRLARRGEELEAALARRDAALRPGVAEAEALARACLGAGATAARRRSPPPREWSWWRHEPDGGGDDDTGPPLDPTVVAEAGRALRAALERRAGTAGLTPEQQDKLRLQQLMEQPRRGAGDGRVGGNSNDANDSSDDGLVEQLLQREQQESAREAAGVDITSVQVRGQKKTIYSF